MKTFPTILPTLNIRYHSPYFVSDEGFVESIEKKTFELLKKHGQIYSLPQADLNKKVHGRYILIDQTAYYFYVNFDNISDEIGTKAHEETHRLHHSRHIHLLEDLIEEKFGKRFNLTSFERQDEEILASIGELYALNSRNLPVGPIGRNCVGMGMAMRIWEKGEFL